MIWSVKLAIRSYIFTKTSEKKVTFWRKKGAELTGVLPLKKKGYKSLFVMLHSWVSKSKEIIQGKMNVLKKIKNKNKKIQLFLYPTQTSAVCVHRRPLLQETNQATTTTESTRTKKNLAQQLFRNKKEKCFNSQTACSHAALMQDTISSAAGLKKDQRFGQGPAPKHMWKVMNSIFVIYIPSKVRVLG